MKRQTFTTGVLAVAFGLSLAPAWAGQRERPAGSETVGSAEPRGESSSSSSSGSSSSGSASSSGGSSSDSSSGSSSAWMGSSSDSGASRAPQRAERPQREDQRRGGSSSSGQAVPRGSSGGSDSASTRGGSSTSSSAGSNDSEGRSRAPVPAYSRPRDGRTPIGTAVERQGPRPGRGGEVYYPGVVYDPYSYSNYDPYYGSRYTSYWSPYGFGYGLGYFSYDPFLFGGYGYNGSGYGSPGYGYSGYGYDPYNSYQGSGGYGSSGARYRGTGSLRLKVKPNHAQIFVDGYYIGVVDSFDGTFQRLGIEAGAHRVELKAEGYEPVQFEVMVTPGETLTYKGDMKRIH